MCAPWAPINHDRNLCDVFIAPHDYIIQRIASVLYLSSNLHTNYFVLHYWIEPYFSFSIFCVSLEQLHYTGHLRYWLHGRRKIFQMKKQRLYDQQFAVQLYNNSFEPPSLVVVRYGTPLNLGNGAKRNQKGKKIVSCSAVLCYLSISIHS